LGFVFVVSFFFFSNALSRYLIAARATNAV